MLVSCVWVSCVVSEGRRTGKAGEEEGRTAGGSAQPKTRTPHNEVGKNPTSSKQTNLKIIIIWHI